MHRLLRRQFKAAERSDGTVDLDILSRLVVAAYEEFERNARRVDRASLLMADEIESSNAALTKSLENVSQANHRFKAILDNVPYGICLYDAEDKVLKYNPTFIAECRLSAQHDYRGMTLRDAYGMIHVFGDDRKLLFEHVSLPCAPQTEIEQTWSDGKVLRISRSKVEGGGYIDTVIDVTEQHKSRARIQHMALYDALTDLPNRVLCRENLRESIACTGRGELSALLYIDLDHFKAVNDTLGHSVGDALLKEVSQRLKSLLRPFDSAARLGGDEFAVVLRRLGSNKDAETVATRIIAKLSAPYRINGQRVSIGASIGIELVRVANTTPDEVIRNADLALYNAKEAGRGTSSVFKIEMYENMTQRREREIELRQALINNELFVHYQPIYNLQQQGISCVEALVRWQSPTRGVLLPSEFIPLAEETGIIDKISQFVLRTACRDALLLSSRIGVSVNLSPMQFRSKKLASQVKSVLLETGLNPSRLELEVTEGVMIADDGNTMKVLEELRLHGVRISLDDFGTGYSSLRYIRKFALNKIKIDQSFVKDIETNPGSVAIIRAIVGMCSSMGIESVAEGVERAEQLPLLRHEGINLVQGYFMGIPKPIESIVDLLSNPLVIAG